MNGNSTRKVRVEAGGSGVVAHVGLHAVGAFADALGLGDVLSGAVAYRGPGIPVHDRGKVLVQTALMLAGGGETCSDVEQLKVSGALFGDVPSDTTVSRTVTGIGADDRTTIAAAIRPLRERVWTETGAASAGPVVLDIDASLIEVHSENKERTAPTFKGGYGFHPMFCFADATGECLAAILRPGNAAANTVTDHVTVLDAAISQLPPTIAAGHHKNDDADLVARDVVVRADSAGCTQGFLAACRERNIGFYVTARSNAGVSEAISDSIGVDAWIPAQDRDGKPRTDDAAVCELTSLINDPNLPSGTRLIVRREPLHPGAQRSLFPSFDYRYWGFYTDQEGNPAELDATMRTHAHVEQHIARLKDSGLCRFPFKHFNANQTWLQLVVLAADLVRWFQLVCLPTSWADARPKRLRWALFHTPGRLVRSARRTIVRVIDSWPTAGVLTHAYQRINQLA